MDALPLIGDGDEHDMLLEIERRFWIAFTDADYRRMNTVGDLEEIVWERLQERAPKARRCATASGFYMLRRSLKQAAPCRSITPSTPIRDIVASPKTLAELTKGQTGLVISFSPTWVWKAGTYLVIASIFAIFPLAVAMKSGWVVLAGLLAIFWGWLMCRFDAQRFGSLVTMGDAARALVDQNFGVFLNRGSRLNRESVSQALKTIIALCTECQAENIHRNTSLIGARA